MKPLHRMKDEELRAKLDATRAMIRRSKKDPANYRVTEAAQIELCYLEREQEHRDKNKEIDKDYQAMVQSELQEHFEILREEEESVKHFLKTGEMIPLQ